MIIVIIINLRKHGMRKSLISYKMRILEIELSKNFVRLDLHINFMKD